MDQTFLVFIDLIPFYTTAKSIVFVWNKWTHCSYRNELLYSHWYYIINGVDNRYDWTTETYNLFNLPWVLELYLYNLYFLHYYSTHRKHLVHYIIKSPKRTFQLVKRMTFYLTFSSDVLAYFSIMPNQKQFDFITSVNFRRSCTWFLKNSHSWCIQFLYLFQIAWELYFFFLLQPSKLRCFGMWLLSSFSTQVKTLMIFWDLTRKRPYDILKPAPL